jgi:DNA-binding response OmpR family regulator
MKKIKLAVVDDEESIRKICAIFFESAGYEVAVFTCGEEFMEGLAVGYRPDAVLLDVMMPGKNGFEICREIKNDPAYKAFKVIIFTALSGSAVQYEAEKAGADSWMTKGSDMDVMASLISNMV